MVVQSSSPLLVCDHNTKETCLEHETECDATLQTEESRELDSETLSAIVKQVEEYFSEDNLRKDAFLLKHVKRNRDGFVSLKLIASLRRIKSLTKNWQDVATAVRQQSKSLTLNAEGSKVKRAAALPLDLLLQSRGKRIVLLHGLKSAVVQDISKSLAGYGDIVSIRLFGHTEGHEVVTKIYPGLDLGSAALVEYESVAAAEKAVELIRNNLITWRNSLGAVIFGGPVSYPSQSGFQRLSNKSSDKAEEPGRRRSRTLTNNLTEEACLLRRKSRSCNGIETADFSRKANSSHSEFALHRQPLGPDGSRGFNKRLISS